MNNIIFTNFQSVFLAVLMLLAIFRRVSIASFK